MAKRLMTLRQIQAEKFPRSRSWVFAEMARGRFPKPIGGCVPHLWEEAVIDAYVEQFVKDAKERGDVGAQRIAVARKPSAAKDEAALKVRGRRRSDPVPA